MMRFVVIIKTTPHTGTAGDASTGDACTGEDLRGWGVLHREMVEAGALLVGGDVASPDTGARVTITADEVVVMGGPFAETTELIVAVWVLQVGSREEALTWVRRIPRSAGRVLQVEVRHLPDAVDGPDTTAP